MKTYFSVTNHHLLALSPVDAVLRFRELLYADGLRLGIPLTNIHVSDLINVADGGIDAFVEDIPPSTIIFDGALRLGQTGYQVKTGDSFKPWTASDIKEELFGPNTPSKDTLAEGVRECLEKGGTYVLVCFGRSLNDKEHKGAVKQIKAHLAMVGFKRR